MFKALGVLFIDREPCFCEFRTAAFVAVVATGVLCVVHEVFPGGFQLDRGIFQNAVLCFLAASTAHKLSRIFCMAFGHCSCCWKMVSCEVEGFRIERDTKFSGKKISFGEKVVTGDTSLQFLKYKVND